jgi:hypothetical protein
MRSPTLKYFLEKRHVDHGGAMVEFAIVLPLLLILVFGIIEFGILMYNRAVLSNASREGARYGIISEYDKDTDIYTYPETDEVKNVIIAYLKRPDSDGNIQPRLINFGPDFDSIFKLNELDYSDIDGNGKNTPGDKLKVEIEYSYSFLVFSSIYSLFGETFPTTVKLKAETTMRLF